jgi:EAL and modified HD-GYP domain-containing signal transduction protein
VSDAYIARQPIFDRRMRIFGYEILYRENARSVPETELDGDQATSNVLIDIFTYHDLDRLIGDFRAFINLTPTFLYDPSILPLSRERLVLEVLEDIAVNRELLAALEKLNHQGYTLALDDFILTEQTRPLLPMADIIKVDIQQVSRDDLRGYVAEFRPYGAHLLAEKVETHEELDFCRALGFHYFQGFFLSRPRVLKTRRLPADRVRILNLLRRLQDPDLNFDELAELVAEDVYLSYRLLRLINSAYFPIRRKVESIQRAVVYLGLNGVRTWATWIALAGIHDKPSELKLVALARARMCALLCDALEARYRDRFFTVGLFSAVDALLDMPMEQALEPLPLAEDVRDAILQHAGLMGRALDATLGYERGEWDRADKLPLAPGRIREIYLDALQWARDIDEALQAEAP